MRLLANSICLLTDLGINNAYVQGHCREAVLVATIQVAMSGICHGLSHLDESHVESVDISDPEMLAEIAPGQYNLIDGNYRTEKARRPTLLMKQYWNDKLG